MAGLSNVFKKTPIPVAGLALGLAALGNLLQTSIPQPFGNDVRAVCGIVAALLVAMLVVRVVRYSGAVLEDFRNPIFASVSGTFFMALMQLAGYLEPFAHVPAFALWIVAVAAHAVLICWFTAVFIASFKLSDVYPTYFICYVGIIVGAVTAPAFGMEHIGRGLFVFGFICYMALLALVTVRYVRLGVAEPARPLFCIYAAPMSLSLAGYLTVFPTPNVTFALVLAVLAQLLFAMVLVRLPSLLRLCFYPSYAAMTFPFVITATALGKVIALLRADGVAVPAAVDWLLAVETAFAAVMVLYVLVRYLMYFAGLWREGRAASGLADASDPTSLTEVLPVPATASSNGAERSR